MSKSKELELHEETIRNTMEKITEKLCRQLGSMPKTHPVYPTRIARIIEESADLFIEHSGQLMMAIDESSTRIRTCANSVKFDCKGPIPEIQVKFVLPREASRDQRLISGEDPSQTTLGDGAVLSEADRAAVEAAQQAADGEGAGAGSGEKKKRASRGPKAAANT